MNFDIFIMIFGSDRYFRFLEKLLIPSLLQDGNLPKLIEAGYRPRFCFYTLKDSEQNVYALIKRMALDSIADTKVMKGIWDENGDESNRRQVQISMLIHAIETCVAEQRGMLFAPVDTYFGNGSIYNTVAATAHVDTCIAWPVLRVTDTEFMEVWQKQTLPIANSRLATLGLRTAHPAVLAGRVKNKPSAIFALGTAVYEIHPNLFLINHRNPNVYFAKFKDSDLNFFSLRRDFRLWDALWPAKLLSEGRLKNFGSSTSAFTIQITALDKARHDYRFDSNNEYGDYSFSHVALSSYFFEIHPDEPVFLP